MENYRFATQHDDGSWAIVEFQRDDDDDAVDYGLLNRTANACALFCDDRLVATFDGVAAPAPVMAGMPRSRRLELVH